MSTSNKKEDDLEKYSGNIRIRIPKDLHKKLSEEAKKQGVSLNNYCQYLLSMNLEIYVINNHRKTFRKFKFNEIAKVNQKRYSSGKMRKFTEEDKFKIEKLRAEGKTYKFIANEFKCSVGGINKILDKKNKIEQKGDKTMVNKKNIFDMHELYNLTCAQYSAITLEAESGMVSDWSEFAGHLEYKFNSLSESEQDKFEKVLTCAAKEEAGNIKMLEELDENDFENEDDFWKERKELQKDITNEALDLLKEYWSGK